MAASDVEVGKVGGFWDPASESLLPLIPRMIEGSNLSIEAIAIGCSFEFSKADEIDEIDEDEAEIDDEMEV